MLGPPVCVKCEKMLDYTENVGWRCPQCGLDSNDHAFTIPKALFDKLFPVVALIVTLLAVSCTPCFYRMDSQGYYKICGGVVKCTSTTKLPSEGCK